MHGFRRFGFLISFSLALLTAWPAGAAERTQGALELRPFLSPMFGDHMVLQRGKPNTFWGWTRPGQHVRVTVAEKSAESVSGPDGEWQVAIDVPPPGGPYEVKVDGPEHIVLRDVLVGDVWLCGGQSNMEVPLRATDGGEEEARQAERPELRLLTVPAHVAYVPAATTAGEWRTCSPQTASGFSAVGYYFGQKLQAELHVPIGLVQDCVGGSPAESWISAESLARIGEFGPQIAEIARLHAKGGEEYGSFLMHWLEEHDSGGRNDAWAGPELDDGDWKAVAVPGGFDELGVPTDPVVAWFRRVIILPAPLPAGPTKIYLGVIDKMDTVYINGRWVGASSWVENPRVYMIPAGVLQPGRNVIVVRVFRSKPAGGFMSPAATLRVELGDGREVPLAGPWRAKVSYDACPPAALPLDVENYPTMPTVLFDGMIAPVVPLAITGAIWYQGEANAWRPPDQYRKLLPALIADWREHFGQGEFPFYIVSLPRFLPHRDKPGTDGWADLRGVQAETARCVRNTALAVTVDTGDAENIHPRNKRPVGERLALCALAGHYRWQVEASGPTLRFVERRLGALALHFDHVDGGLKVHGTTLGEFALAGDDGVWKWAKARIEGKDVVVLSSPDVPAPVVAEYAWQGNPLATLFNSDGLPAVPFRTDE